MSGSNTVWNLPGPASFVREVRRTAGLGQHVAVVLPRVHLVEGGIASTLVDELAGVREDIEYLEPDSGSETLVEAIASALFLDDPPLTVRKLFEEESLAGRSFVFSALELSDDHREELPELLRRLESDSRAVGALERPTFVAVVGPNDLPMREAESRAEIALADVWFWNRASRWDVAAHLALQDREDRHDGLLGEVRLEVIVEAAKWDLDLATELSHGWSGDAVGLLDYLKTPPGSEPVDLPAHRRDHARRPPEALVDLWDAGGLGFWHGALAIAPSHRIRDIAAIDRLVWSAQARVLLPWLELRREQLAQRVEAEVGVERFQAQLARTDHGKYDDAADDVVEVGHLAHLISLEYGRSRRQFCDTAHTLKRARNALAHLRPMTDLEIRNLVEQTQWLA